jgi:hypothetical protein
MFIPCTVILTEIRPNRVAVMKELPIQPRRLSNDLRN